MRVKSNGETFVSQSQRNYVIFRAWFTSDGGLRKVVVKRSDNPQTATDKYNAEKALLRPGERLVLASRTDGGTVIAEVIG